MVQSLETQAKEDKFIISKEREEKRNLSVSNVKLIGKIKDLEKEVKNLEEHERKSTDLLAQGNEEFTRMLTMGKESRDRQGIGYELHDSTPNSSSLSEGATTTFVKGKGRCKTSIIAPLDRANINYVKKKFSYPEKGK